MKISYWFKFAALTLALTVTMISIYWLKQGHLTKAIHSLGITSSQHMLNWCNNRVKALSVPSKAFITEEAGKWMWKNKNPMVLNYLSVEKWFAKYCQLPIERIHFSDFNSPMTPLLEVTFINGETATFYDLGEGRVQLQDNIFASPSLNEALQELLAFGPKLE